MEAQHIAIARNLLSGQVGSPLMAVGQVGDLVALAPYYPGRAGEPQASPYYPGVGAPTQAVPQSGQAPMQYSQPQYPMGDVTYLGFGRTLIPAGSIGTEVDVSTQRPFTPQKMGCPSTVVGLLLKQVMVSGTNVLSNALGVPLELVSEVSTFPQILWPPLDTATGVQFIVSNPTAGDLFFEGAFYGAQLRR